MREARRLAAPVLTAIDRLADQGSSAGSKQRSQCVATDGVTQNAAGNGAYNQSRRAIVTAAIVPPIATPIDPVLSSKPPLSIVSLAVVLVWFPA